MFTLFVDADSLPLRLRKIILQRAMKENMRTIFVADRNLKDVCCMIEEHTASLRLPLRNTLDKTELRKIERCQLLILDDLFLVPLDAKERPILLEIIEDRHKRKSIIITSQYPSSNWYDMVGDPTIADAILDRIIHTAHTIELYGESMRKLRAKK